MSPDALELRCTVSLPGFRLEVDEMLDVSGFTAVFGPSGSGKSTLLRAIAGFARPAAGRIARGGDVWFDGAAGVHVPPHRRPVGFVFQDDRLFTHLDVAGNLAFAEKRRRAADGPDRDAVVEALGLASLLDRAVTGLSGGERRRVALGRTLLTAPRLLLLDEPLTGLDRDRKADVLEYLKAVPRNFGVPALYVSHDVDEVATLADDLLVLESGRVRMHGPAAELLERLDLEPLAGRFEGGVLVEGRVTGHDHRLHLTRVDVGGDDFVLPLVDRVALGDALRLRIRARDVALALERPHGISIRNVLPGTVIAVGDDPEPGFADVRVRLAGAGLRARVTRAAVEELALAPDVPVFALVKSVSFERLG